MWASSESRALIRCNERGVSKSVLVKLSSKEINDIADANSLPPAMLKKNYMVAKEGKSGVFIFKATYGPPPPMPCSRKGGNCGRSCRSFTG